jgi:hypothetical protein
MLQHNPTTGRLTPQERAEIERQMGPINVKLTAPKFTTEEWRKLHVERYALEQMLLGE